MLSVLPDTNVLKAKKETYLVLLRMILTTLQIRSKVKVAVRNSVEISQNPEKEAWVALPSKVLTAADKLGQTRSTRHGFPPPVPPPTADRSRYLPSRYSFVSLANYVEEKQVFPQARSDLNM